MTDDAQGMARPASVEDLKLLLGALHDKGVDYLLIGGYALYALGYQRGTVDIDIVVQPTLEQGEKVRHALLMLPDGVAKDLDPTWFPEGETIRVADAFVVDLMFNACGETYQSLLPYAVTIDLEGVPVRTLTLEGLLKTKQSSRDKDRLDRLILERALGGGKDG
jgi:predicted nucleotidyltransferase